MLGIVISFSFFLIGLLIVIFNKKIGLLCYKNSWIFTNYILNPREQALAFGCILLLLSLGSIINQIFY